MKTSKLLCITIISIFTYSCNSDDDDSNSNSQNYSELIIEAGERNIDFDETFPEMFWLRDYYEND